MADLRKYVAGDAKLTGEDHNALVDALQGVPVVVSQARGDFGASPGSYPAGRPTGDLATTYLWLGDDPGSRALLGTDLWLRPGT